MSEKIVLMAYKIMKLLLVVVHIASIRILIKFAYLHYLYFPRMHNMMKEEITVVCAWIIFISISICVYKHPLDLIEFERKGTR